MEKERLSSSGKFVRELHVFDEGTEPDAPETRDERFAFGPDCLSGRSSFPDRFVEQVEPTGGHPGALSDP